MVYCFMDDFPIGLAFYGLLIKDCVLYIGCVVSLIYLSSICRAQLWGSCVRSFLWFIGVDVTCAYWRWHLELALLIFRFWHYRYSC